MTLTRQALVTALPCSSLSGGPSPSSGREVYAPTPNRLTPHLLAPASSEDQPGGCFPVLLRWGHSGGAHSGQHPRAALPSVGGEESGFVNSLWSWIPPQVVTFPSFTKTCPLPPPTLETPSVREAPSLPLGSETARVPPLLPSLANGSYLGSLGHCQWTLVGHEHPSHVPR